MKGVDISHYQKGLTIKQIKDAGNDFAIIKITEGAWLKDAAAFGFYREAYETGFPVGGYCYSHALTVEDAENEARFLLDTVNSFPLPCGVFLDMEEDDQLALPKEKLLAIISTWCNVLFQAGYIPGVYSSVGTLWARIKPDDVDDGCLVWVAKWGQQPPDTPCDVWQSSDSGNIGGVTVDTDEPRSDRFKKLVEIGFNMPAVEPLPEPKAEGKPDISGALEMLAAYIRTPEFEQNFLKFIHERSAAK